MSPATTRDTTGTRRLRVGVVVDTDLAITGGLERCVLEDTRELVAAGHEVEVWHRDAVPAGATDDGPRRRTSALGVPPGADADRLPLRRPHRAPGRRALRPRGTPDPPVAPRRPLAEPSGVPALRAGRLVGVRRPARGAPAPRTELPPPRPDRRRPHPVLRRLARDGACLGRRRRAGRPHHRRPERRRHRRVPRRRRRPVRDARAPHSASTRPRPTVLYYGRLTRSKGVLALLEAWGRVLSGAPRHRVPVTTAPAAAPRAPRRGAAPRCSAGALYPDEADAVHARDRRAPRRLRARCCPSGTTSSRSCTPPTWSWRRRIEPEGFGRVVVEAMSAGRPVVAAASGRHRRDPRPTSGRGSPSTRRTPTRWRRRCSTPSTRPCSTPPSAHGAAHGSATGTAASRTSPRCCGALDDARR